MKMYELWLVESNQKFIYFGELFKFLLNVNVQKSRRCTHCSCKSLRLCSALCKLSRSFIIFEICILDDLFCTCANQHPPIPITTDTIRTRSFIQLCGGPGAKYMGILVRLPVMTHDDCLFILHADWISAEYILHPQRVILLCSQKACMDIWFHMCLNDTHQLYLRMTFKKPQQFDQNSLYCGFSQLMIWF